MFRCPWHGACFNASTGDIEDFPGLDGLACHRVTWSSLTSPASTPASRWRRGKGR